MVLEKSELGIGDDLLSFFNIDLVIVKIGDLVWEFERLSLYGLVEIDGWVFVCFGMWFGCECVFKVF